MGTVIGGGKMRTSDKFLVVIGFLASSTSARAECVDSIPSYELFNLGCLFQGASCESEAMAVSHDAPSYSTPHWREESVEGLYVTGWSSQQVNATIKKHAFRVKLPAAMLDLETVWTHDGIHDGNSEG